MRGKKIPVNHAKETAKKYSYDHVIIIAWNNEDNRSWWTTYGTTKQKCKFAKEVSENLKEVF